MSLPPSQQRALMRIEKTLADDHPSLGPLFAMFTRLAGHEALPVTERVTARPRRMWPAIVTVVGLSMVAGALLTLSLMLPSPRACAPGTAIPVAVHTRSVQAACTTQPDKPSKILQSGPYAH